jgi:hypothetical protein
MINALGERRNIADGAHCSKDFCLLDINERICDLGAIFNARSEEEAVKILRKYAGDSDEVYWIASKDLIGKYRWILYYGTGCERCNLYIPLRLSSYSLDPNNTIAVANYEVGALKVKVVFLNKPYAFLEYGYNLVPIEKVIYRNETYTASIKEHLMLQAVFKSYRILNATPKEYPGIDYNMVYVSDNKLEAVLIPENLEDVLFTKLFFLNGKGLKRFKPVLINDEVKLLRVEMY